MTIGSSEKNPSNFMRKMTNFIRKTAKFSKIFRKNAKIFDKILQFLEFGAVRRNDNLKELEKCCKMRPWLQKSASIQPRTSRPKFADTNLAPPNRHKYRSGVFIIKILRYFVSFCTNSESAVEL